MPYISKDEVKQIRIKLKSALPKFKLSVRTKHNSEILVSIVSGPIDFGETYIQVNHFYINRDWNDLPECMNVLNTINNIIQDQKPIDGHNDSDYGFIPNYYTSIHVGAWNKPYEMVA